MTSKFHPIAAALGLGLITGCTAGNGALEPPFTSVNLASNKLQMAVGVATFKDGSKGINVVATFRQPNGLSATLLNTPTLTGPFTVPVGAVGTRSAAGSVATCTPNIDAGTGTITGSPQQLVTANANCSTFGQSGGIFANGFAPENSTTAQAPVFQLYGDKLTSTVYGGPLYGTTAQRLDDGFGAYRGGPPAYPNVRNGTYPAAFRGYPLGYTTFAMTPVVGAYNLSTNIPSANNAGATLTAPTANLGNAVGLPAFAAAPTFVSDAAGGGTASCTAPAGTTETIVELVDKTTTAWYTQVVNGGGAVSATFGDMMGPSASGSTAFQATLNTGDKYEIGCIAVDYGLFEAGPPANTSQTPSIVGASGQSDISFSTPGEGTY